MEGTYNSNGNSGNTDNSNGNSGSTDNSNGNSGTPAEGGSNGKGNSGGNNPPENPSVATSCDPAKGRLQSNTTFSYSAKWDPKCKSNEILPDRCLRSRELFIQRTKANQSTDFDSSRWDSRRVPELMLHSLNGVCDFTIYAQSNTTTSRVPDIDPNYTSDPIHLVRLKLLPKAPTDPSFHHLADVIKEPTILDACSKAPPSVTCSSNTHQQTHRVRLHDTGLQ